MTLQIYNTLTRTREEFIPGGEKKESIDQYPPVTMYSCGPTVYSYAHIGNFRTFIFNDTLRRYLKFRGFTVNHAMNITDVDDKTINGALEEGLSLREYTDKYIQIFQEDLKTLNIETTEHTPRATESIDDMVHIMKNLDEKGLMYEKDGSHYFSIGKYERYGKLSRVDSGSIKSGTRYDTDEYHKDDIRDFALWKKSAENEATWETPFGPGRPGWHIECSAMIEQIFHDTIDIHTGGVDLIFPHHENEIAQSEAAFDRPFVRYWVHAEHLLVESSKMSKSKGNFYTLRDLLGKGYSARSIRYLLMSAHYRKQLNFTLEGLTQAASALERIDNLLIRLGDISLESVSEPKDIDSDIKTFYTDFTETVDDDLNIAGGLGLFFDFLHHINSLISEEKITVSDTEKIIAALQDIDSVFGFIFSREEVQVDEAYIQEKIDQRNEAKKSKDFQKADEIRDELLAMNIVLEDTKDGTRWKIK